MSRCYNSRCPFQKYFANCDQECSSTDMCPYFVSSMGYGSASNHTETTFPFNGCSVTIRPTNIDIEHDPKPTSDGTKEGKIVKIKAKKVPTFEEKLQAWHDKVLRAYNMSKAEPDDDTLIMFDTYKMIHDVDVIIAEGFGHITVLDDED